MCVGNSKTLIKFGAWLFLIILENQEENLSCFLCFASITLFTIFFTFLHHIFRFYIKQPHQFLKVINKGKNQSATWRNLC